MILIFVMTKKSTITNTGQILERSFIILHKEGWEGFSMRKLADTMNCSAAIIYSYFPSKEKLLASVVRIGVLKLTACLKRAKGRQVPSHGLTEAMWLAYYDFAVSHQTFYQLMFGINIPFQLPPEELEVPIGLLLEANNIPNDNPDQLTTRIKFYTCWSLVHGYLALAFTNRQVLSSSNKQEIRNGIRLICFPSDKPPDNLQDQRCVNSINLS